MLHVMPDTTELEALIARLVSDRTLLQRGEAATRQAAVNPTLRALGWNTDNLDEVDPEFADSDGGKVDYCLRHQGKDLVLIEVKRASADLSLHQEQLLRYAFGLGVELAALTNGLDWWLYLPMKGGRSFEGRRFARVDFRARDAGDAATTLSRFLDRDACVSGSTLAEAEAEFERQERANQVRAVLPEAWSRVLGDAQLHELLAREVERIAGVAPDPSAILEYVQTLAGGVIRSAPSAPSGGDAPAREAVPGSSAVHAGPAATREPQSFKGLRLVAFWLDGVRYEASNWRRMLQSVCEQMADEAGVSFAQVVVPVRGRTRIFFSNNPGDLRGALEIGSSGLYVEGHLPADECVRLARRTIEAVRGADAGFRIEAEQRTQSTAGASPAAPSSLSRPSPADLVVELLEEVGGPLHYREIEQRLRESGKFEAGGRDPANTLLGRFFNEPRLTRTGRGTYSLLPGGGASPPLHDRDAGNLQATALGEPERFAGRRLAAFWLNGVRHEVRSWPLMVRTLSEQLMSEVGPAFDERVAAVRGRTRHYFSTQPDDLTHPRQLADSHLYVEGNLGPDAAVRVARLTLRAVRGSDDGFRIELAE